MRCSPDRNVKWIPTRKINVLLSWSYVQSLNTPSFHTCPSFDVFLYVDFLLQNLRNTLSNRDLVGRDGVLNRNLLFLSQTQHLNNFITETFLYVSSESWSRGSSAPPQTLSKIACHLLLQHFYQHFILVYVVQQASHWDYRITPFLFTVLTALHITLNQGWPTFWSESATERTVKAAGTAPRKYIYYYKKHNLQYEINQCEIN